MGGGARSMRITRDSEEENEKNKRSDAARDDGMETVKRRTRGWRSLDRCSNGFLLVLQLGCLGLNGLDGCPKDSIVVCPRREGGPTRVSPQFAAAHYGTIAPTRAWTRPQLAARRWRWRRGSRAAVAGPR